MSTDQIATAVVSSVRPDKGSPRAFANALLADVNAAGRIEISGKAKGDHGALFARGLRPKFRIRLFDTTFYLSNVLQLPELRFMVAYIVQTRRGRTRVSARIFYKDLSLAWRVASHFTCVDEELWVGKGDVVDVQIDGVDMLVSNEATTDLPIEMQTALEMLIKGASPIRGGMKVLELVLRRARGDRVSPFADFVRERQRAQANPRNLINRGRPILRFSRPGDPTSLRIIKGFEPDFRDGVLERARSRSALYGGVLRRHRVLAVNRKVQYYFYSGKKHVWLMPPQALTTELSGFGVRTIDVDAADDLFIPGYEYHHYEDTPHGLELYSQIPEGFAGEPCPHDEDKADASPWLDAIPLIAQFRREVLKQ